MVQTRINVKYFSLKTYKCKIKNKLSKTKHQDTLRNTIIPFSLKITVFFPNILFVLICELPLPQSQNSLLYFVKYIHVSTSLYSLNTACARVWSQLGKSSLEIKGLKSRTDPHDAALISVVHVDSPPERVLIKLQTERSGGEGRESSTILH